MLPVLLNCTDCAAELAPTLTLPNARVLVLVAAVVCRPVPERETDFVPTLVLSESVLEAGLSVVGVKVI